MRFLANAIGIVSLWWIDPPLWWALSMARLADFLDPDMPDDLDGYRIVSNCED